jgi:hypothetical protein
MGEAEGRPGNECSLSDLCSLELSVDGETMTNGTKIGPNTRDTAVDSSCQKRLFIPIQCLGWFRFWFSCQESKRFPKFVQHYRTNLQKISLLTDNDPPCRDLILGRVAAGDLDQIIILNGLRHWFLTSIS